MDSDKRTGGGYLNLEIYQRSHALAVEVHRASIIEMPKFEMYEQGSQIRRSAKSIVANIVEGYGRRVYKAEYVRFLRFAHASCDETMAHLRLIRDTGSLPEERVKPLLEAYDVLGRQLFRFIASIAQGLPGGS